MVVNPNIQCSKYKIESWGNQFFQNCVLQKIMFPETGRSKHHTIHLFLYITIPIFEGHTQPNWFTFVC